MGENIQISLNWTILSGIIVIPVFKCLETISPLYNKIRAINITKDSFGFISLTISLAKKRLQDWLKPVLRLLLPDFWATKLV